MHDEPKAPAASPRDEQAPEPVAAPRKISSSELFNGSREIVIEHGDRIYRMRITQNDKLILTA